MNNSIPKNEKIVYHFATNIYPPCNQIYANLQ
jgi:hypothetical protein